MAVVDAIWRVHIKGEAMHSNEGGTYQLFEFLCPCDATKLSSNPSYHMLNDGIQHLVWEYLWVCWEDATGVLHLQDFVEKEPSWDEIKILLRPFMTNI